MPLPPNKNSHVCLAQSKLWRLGLTLYIMAPVTQPFQVWGLDHSLQHLQESLAHSDLLCARLILILFLAFALPHWNQYPICKACFVFLAEACWPLLGFHLGLMTIWGRILSLEIKARLAFSVWEFGFSWAFSERKGISFSYIFCLKSTHSYYTLVFFFFFLVLVGWLVLWWCFVCLFVCFLPLPVSYKHWVIMNL